MSHCTWYDRHVASNPRASRLEPPRRNLAAQRMRPPAPTAALRCVRTAVSQRAGGSRRGRTSFMKQILHSF